MGTQAEAGTKNKGVFIFMVALVLLLVIGCAVAIGLAVHNANSFKSKNEKLRDMREHIAKLEKNDKPIHNYLWSNSLGDMSQSAYEAFKENLMEELASQDVNVGIETISVKKEYMRTMGYGKDIYYQHRPGQCRRVPGADGGSEDITVMSNGILLMSSGWFPNVPGRVLMYDFENPQNNVTELTIKLGPDSWLDLDEFHPHGISSWTENGVMYFYVLHHLPLEDSIEMFQYNPDEKSITHMRNFTSPNFNYMNDFVMVAIDSFYITKFWRYRDVARTRLEIRLLANLGEIMFYDGSKPTTEAATTLIKGLTMPNGINISPDGRYVYMAEVGTLKLHIYKRDLQSNSLEELAIVNTDTGIDNIEVDPLTGDLWIGCHPIVHKAWEYIERGATGIAPSQAVRVRVVNGTVVDMIEPYINNGEEISASTSATFYNGQIAIGALADSAILVCDATSID